MTATRIAIGALVLLAAACIDTLVGADPPNAPNGVFETVWTDFDRNYSFFDVKHIDWNAVHQRYAPQANAARTVDEVAPIIGAMFTELHDPHVDLVVSSATTYSSVNLRAIHTYFDATNISPKYVSSTQVTTSRKMLYGMAAPDVGYVWIPSFGGTGWGAEIDEAIRSFAGAAGIVLDLRNNGGGNSGTSDTVAARFVDQSRVFAFVRYRTGPAHGDLSDYMAKTIGPAGTHFPGHVVVLTNRLEISATEDFLLAMRSQPGVRFIGDTTAGGMGNPLVRELPQGWVYRLPHWIEYGPSKELYEGIGIPPDEFVPQTANDSVARRDRQLERAIAVARGG